MVRFPGDDDIYIDMTTEQAEALYEVAQRAMGILVPDKQVKEDLDPYQRSIYAFSRMSIRNDNRGGRVTTPSVRLTPAQVRDFLNLVRFGFYCAYRGTIQGEVIRAGIESMEYQAFVKLGFRLIERS